jgi:HNH endonuclease
MEEWRAVVIKGTRLPFEVSDLGRVRRVAGPDAIGRFRKSKRAAPHIVGSGYLQVILIHNFVRYSPLVHTLVAFAFLPPPPGEYGRGKIALNHKNGIKTDNRPTNLEWVTYQENSDHASTSGLMLTGENNPASVLTEAKVRKIRRLYANGMTRADIRRHFKCSYCAIDLICRRVTWKHVT